MNDKPLRSLAAFLCLIALTALAQGKDKDPA
jgi:hypothetical protein